MQGPLNHQGSASPCILMLQIDLFLTIITYGLFLPLECGLPEDGLFGSHLYVPGTETLGTLPVLSKCSGNAERVGKTCEGWGPSVFPLPGHLGSRPSPCPFSRRQLTLEPLWFRHFLFRPQCFSLSVSCPPQHCWCERQLP